MPQNTREFPVGILLVCSPGEHVAQGVLAPRILLHCFLATGLGGTGPHCNSSAAMSWLNLESGCLMVGGGILNLLEKQQQADRLPRNRKCLYANFKHYFSFSTLFFLPHEPHVCVPAQSFSCVCLFCDSVDCSPPVSSVHGIILARILEWVAISSDRGSSWPRDWTLISCVSCIGKYVLYHWATCEAPPRTPPCNRYSKFSETWSQHHIRL